MATTIPSIYLANFKDYNTIYNLRMKNKPKVESEHRFNINYIGTKRNAFKRYPL